MMLSYIIPFEKRFCSYLKLLRLGRCRVGHARANKHALGCLPLPSLQSVYAVVLTLEGCILNVTIKTN